MMTDGEADIYGYSAPQKEQGRWRNMTPGDLVMPRTLKSARAAR